MANDRFLGLETDSEATLAWQGVQNEVADRALREWEGFGAPRDCVAPHLAGLAMSAPVHRGGYWFRVDNGHLVVADSPTARGRVLVDPGDASLDWFFP